MDQLPAEFVEAMNNDITTPTALGVVFSTIRNGNSKLAALAAGDESSRDEVEKALLDVRAMLDVFGLDPLAEPWASNGSVRTGGATAGSSDDSMREILKSLIEEQLAKREEARKTRNFTLADSIRDHLKSIGVSIEDKPHGPSTWKIG